MSLFRLLILIISVTSATLWGAAPLFHAYVADKWVEILEDYSEEEKQTFIRGTLFPDIRYPANLARTVTHQHGLTLEQIKQTPDPFLKGLRLHTFVDDIREEMVEQLGIIPKLDERVPGKAYYLLKLIEDDILYSMIPKAKPLYYAECLKAVDPGALQFQVELETIEYWHKINSAYFKQTTSRFLLEHIRSARSFLGLSGAALQDFYQVMIESQSQEPIRNHVKRAVDQFEKIFTDFRAASESTDLTSPHLTKLDIQLNHHPDFQSQDKTDPFHRAL